MIDAIVTGQSLPALQSALDLAEVGLKVAVLSPEKSDSFEPSAERDPEGSIAEFITRIAETIEQADRQLAVVLETAVRSALLVDVFPSLADDRCVRRGGVHDHALIADRSADGLVTDRSEPLVLLDQDAVREEVAFLPVDHDDGRRHVRRNPGRKRVGYGRFLVVHQGRCAGVLLPGMKVRDVTLRLHKPNLA